MVIYLIQGVFFQDREILDYAPFTGPVVVSLLAKEMFVGVLELNTENSALPTTGFIIDRYDEADLTEIVLDGNLLSFTKKYRNRGHHDTIRCTYVLLPDGSWYGEWIKEGEGAVVLDSGESHCILTEVDKSFFDSTAKNVVEA